MRRRPCRRAQRLPPSRSRGIPGASTPRSGSERRPVLRLHRRFRTYDRPFAYFFLTGRCQPGMDTCLARDRVSSPAGASLVSVVPAPSVAPRPTRTGATSCVSEPMKTSSSMMVRCLFAPVVVAHVRAGTDVDVATDMAVADEGQGIGLETCAYPARLHLHEVPDVHFCAWRRALPRP